MEASLTPFQGHWTLTRVVREAGQVSHFEGTAVLDADGLFREEGQWTQGPYAGLGGMRRYLWRPGIEVLFDDGRPFHRFDPQLTDQTVSHWCDPDRYDGRYLIDLPGRFSVAWRVTGPRKDYLSETLYLRSGAPQGRKAHMTREDGLNGNSDE